MKSLFLSLPLWVAATFAHAQTPVSKSMGQTLYLPIYSHIWHGDSSRDIQPAKTLVSVSVSIRNTDARKPIRITSAQYFDTDGNRLREYLPSAKTIGPMGTFELFVPRGDDTGGSGANFIIGWKADQPASPPLVQGLHANMPVGRSLAFTTSAIEIPAD